MTDLPLPAVLTSTGTGLDEFLATERPRIRQLLQRHGAVLLRGFDVDGVDGLDRTVRTLSGAPLTYSERSSPRSTIKGQVYTSTDYPPDEEIFLHNENSYQAAWPLTLYFYCAQPPDTLGATPLADIRQVYRSIDPSVRAEFTRRKWMVVRNFHDGFGVSWRHVFNTEDRAEVAGYCARNGIELEWRGTDGLRTRAIREPVHTHPGTGATVWFNHATFFHVTTLPTDVHTGLREIFEDEDLPSNTFYGDGGRIPDDVIAHLRACYRAASVRFDWARHDILVVDNMLAAHGREPFTGPRRIAVAMAELSTAARSLAPVG
ncbi:MAG TPA: TauD/TfdA family dioxygenase [Mycobacteriales bacterium]|nr:TauD/TfdA family dioxygenase [Mycobacteriales bacterium]